MFRVQLHFLLLVILSAAAAVTTIVFSANVTYDSRAIRIDGKRRILISGSIHYPRSTPEMWQDLIAKSKDGGLDVIETYVFWNLHEPSPQKFDFSGRKDLVRFVKLVQEAGLYVHLRIGPYVCAEWNYGGFPVWLHQVPGIKFRTNNEPFKAAMEAFTTLIVKMMKQEKLYASQGGPIILSQIENEYGNIDSAYGAAGVEYLKWAAAMAVSQETGVPWVMCQQPSAPDPVINTCNGFYCDDFTPNSPEKPKLWTENWAGWFQSFGGARPHRPAEDIAFAVARFFQKGGTFQNYYMYHGGTNFGRTTGGPFIATTYDYDAPLDEFGLVNNPKWGHLKDLHAAMKLCEAALTASEPQTQSLGPNLEASVYHSESGQCAAFLANKDSRTDATVTFNGLPYSLPAWSVSILPDCVNVVFSTAKIRPVHHTGGAPTFVPEHSAKLSGWSWTNERPLPPGNRSFTRTGLSEQIGTTVDASDYLWYSLSVEVRGDEPFIDAGSAAVLQVESLGHGLHAFVNGRLAGTAFGKRGISASFPVQLAAGLNRIDLLSLTVGLQNYGAFFDDVGAGITGPVRLVNSRGAAALDLSGRVWTYRVGLDGERLGLPDGGSFWFPQSSMPTGRPLLWYKAAFEAPQGDDPVAIDFTGMSKGAAWVNGRSIGRYWPSSIARGGGDCAGACDFRGRYDSDKCQSGCGEPSQTVYHVPRSWIRPDNNVLVMFEELGGDPRKISLVRRRTHDDAIQWVRG